MAVEELSTLASYCNGYWPGGDVKMARKGILPGTYISKKGSEAA